VNLASRLCDHAADGQILVSQSLHSALPAGTKSERIGPMELHGFPSPVSAWRLTKGSDGDGSDGVRPVEDPVVAWPSIDDAAPPETNSFRPDGDYWTVGYKGHVVRMRESKGLSYLARLMAAPGREIHVADLVGLAAPEAAGLRSSGAPVIDEEARRAYQERLVDLEAERDEARDWGDLERAARATEEIAFLAQELSAAYGLGGRARRADDPAERVRKAVTNRIRQTMSKIESVHPDLGRHLANSVRTGSFCVYAPESPVEWKL
jgi:hypothetical protein